ncbi:MAG: Mth938-like domain-containing protein [Burkholderiales bacterium]|nr:Mth938-like domain-containing protein [Burkholderiales bacterium]
MKLHLDRPAATNIITAFGPQFVQVNGVRHATSLIVLAERLLEHWPPRSPEDLTEAEFDRLAGLGAGIVLLGTGARQRFPHPRLAARLLSHGIGLEVMDTAAACRTYNILSGEGRSVAAALIVE